MFKIYAIDDTLIGVTEKLNYIRLHENGSLVLCEETDAQGIAFNGDAYSFVGDYGLADKPVVRIEQLDTAVELQNTNNTTSIAFVTLAEVGSIDAVTAAEHADLFAEWAHPVVYKAGNIRRYNGALYKCVQDHTSQADWTPDVAVSLWNSTSDPAEEWPAWSQPVGAYDAYAEGDKVTHKDIKWVSTTANNVWEPGIYGWTEYTESEAEV